MTIDEFIHQVNTAPASIDFDHTMKVIDDNYDFSPTAFQNGETHNEAGQNNGSCKLFAFAKLLGLNEKQTLACFGDYYRTDVLQNETGDDHQNIRNFIRSGWAGVNFESEALSPR